MTSDYYHASSSSYQPVAEPGTFLRKLLATIEHIVGFEVRDLYSSLYRGRPLGRPSSHSLLPQSFWKRFIVSIIPFCLTVLWIFALQWGEEWVFRNKINDCAWKHWERWPSNASPHRVVLIADPQLVDPHTYPGRPWPLSSLTVRHTDKYLKKSFAMLQTYLAPDSALFLGDLFDGGREWSTPTDKITKSKNPDKRWRKYDYKYWLKEYRRFNQIFPATWSRGKLVQNRIDRGRRFIAELPGNHDLGFGKGIRLPVRQRFNAYFGDGNRIDIIGNHSFVSVDTVSLSALGQEGSDSEDQGIKQLWHPTEQFLSDVKVQKARKVKQYLRILHGLPENGLLDHEVLELNSSTPQNPENSAPSIIQIPSILLTHVPLFRAPGTPCGPLRERYPPSFSSEKLDERPITDERNALPVSAGIQYQTVLTPMVSNELMEKVGDVQAVFSGDDHDYCEIIHRGYTSKNGGIKEITVKAISWAAGIRKPGFLMLSLWNPVEMSEDSLASTGNVSNGQTMTTHLCLLPDQLAIFVRYGFLFAGTLCILLVRATIKVYSRSLSSKADDFPFISQNENLPMDQRISTVSSTVYTNGFAPRSFAGRARTADPLGEHHTLNRGPSPAYLDATKGYLREERITDQNEWREKTSDDEPKRRPRRMFGMVLEEWGRSFKQVASVVFLWYLWLIWKL